MKPLGGAERVTGWLGGMIELYVEVVAEKLPVVLPKRETPDEAPILMFWFEFRFALGPTIVSFRVKPDYF